MRISTDKGMLYIHARMCAPVTRVYQICSLFRPVVIDRTLLLLSTSSRRTVFVSA